MQFVDIGKKSRGWVEMEDPPKKCSTSWSIDMDEGSGISELDPETTSILAFTA
jgi:hypothetical protein